MTDVDPYQLQHESDRMDNDEAFVVYNPEKGRWKVVKCIIKSKCPNTIQ